MRFGYGRLGPANSRLPWKDIRMGLLPLRSYRVEEPWSVLAFGPTTQSGYGRSIPADF